LTSQRKQDKLRVAIQGTKLSQFSAEFFGSSTGGY